MVLLSETATVSVSVSGPPAPKVAVAISGLLSALYLPSVMPSGPSPVSNLSGPTKVPSPLPVSTPKFPRFTSLMLQNWLAAAVSSVASVVAGLQRERAVTARGLKDGSLEGAVAKGGRYHVVGVVPVDVTGSNVQLAVLVEVSQRACWFPRHCAMGTAAHR